MVNKVPGTRDILPEEVSRWQKIEEISRNIFAFYNYREIRPPLIEESSLFNRSLGESADIVKKQMFLIKKDKDTYALRPEGTASIVRAYLENNLDKNRGFIKLYYIGPMFRRERPQKGRLRQFHHIGCEVIGSQDPYVDVEVISLADNLLRAFKVEGYKIKLNNLGCRKDQKKLTEILRQALKDRLSKLCPDCHIRFKQNTLRILDCKKDSCRQVLSKLDFQEEYLCPECTGHFFQVRQGLEALKIDYEISPYLVRGLDYYTRTVFEISHPDLGSQDALGAGGRYDNLVSDLGGPSSDAIGFALGLERMLLVCGLELTPQTNRLVYLITLGEQAKREGLKLLNSLRQAKIAADSDYEGKSLKGALRRAHDWGARYVLILGENELKGRVVTLKDMQSGLQQEIAFNRIIENLKTKLCLGHTPAAS